MPVAAGVLPVAVSEGLRAAYPIPITVGAQAILWLPIIFLLAGGAWVLDHQHERALSVFAVAVLAATGFIWIEFAAASALDQTASARSTWRELQAKSFPASIALPAGVCVGKMNRASRYGLNYYAGPALPDCAANRTPVRIEEEAVTRGHRLVIHMDSH